MVDLELETAATKAAADGGQVLWNGGFCGCARADICRQECKSSTHKKATTGTPDGKMPAESRCSPREIQNYLGRISGPLLDRIDIHVEVPQVKFPEITGEQNGETSATIRKRVVAARQRQHERFNGKPRVTCNAHMGPRELKQFCKLDNHTKELLQFTMRDLNLTPKSQGYGRIRTQGSERPGEHTAENTDEKPGASMVP